MSCWRAAKAGCTDDEIRDGVHAGGDPFTNGDRDVSGDHQPAQRYVDNLGGVHIGLRAVEVVLRLREREGLVESIDIVLSLFELPLQDLIGVLLQLLLNGLLEHSEGCAVALFYGSQHRGTVGAHGIDEVERLGVQSGETIVWQSGLHIAEHGANVHASCARLNEQTGIDRSIEERELPGDALDVLAVTQLEQSIGHGLPVAEQFVVRRNLEVKSLRTGHAASVAASAAPALTHYVFDVHHGVGERIEFGSEVVVRIVRVPWRGDRRRLRT